MNPSSPADTLLTVLDLWRHGISTLNRAEVFFGHGLDNAQDEVRQLLLHTLALPRDEDPSPWLSARVLPDERAMFLERLNQRIHQRIPVPYLTQEAWLGNLPFYCDERVLIPRSFLAEVLDEGLEALIPNWPALHRVADVCTGGGSLAILLALKCPDAQVDATELSADALAVASLNRARYGLEDRLQLFQGDLLTPLESHAYDLIITNPPYVDQAAMRALPPEYRCEPKLALESGADGLDHIRRILQQAAQHLTVDGWLLAEVGHQAEALESAFPQLPFIWLDLASGGQHVFALPYEALPGARR